MMNLTDCERIFGSVIYKIPNFCITDPAVERDYQTIKEKYEGVESEPLIIKCFCFTNLKEIQMEVTNRTTGKFPS